MIEHSARAAAAGEPREDLTWIAAAQPFVSTGPRVSPAAVELIRAARASARLDRRQFGSPAGRELVGAGLVDARSRRFGPLLIIAAAVLSRSGLAIGAESRDAAARALFSAWTDGERALLAAEQPQSAGTPRDGLAALEIVDLEHLPARIASWLGLAPAWTFGDPDELAVPAALAQERLLDPTVPAPDGAGKHLRYAWAQPWRQLSVGFNPGNHGVKAMAVGDAGYLVSYLDENGTERLHPIPTSSLFIEIIEHFARGAG
jgi:hypothetical protein